MISFRHLASQYHMGVSISKNVTILAAGYHNPKSGGQGSGIYHGASKILNFTTSPSKLISAKIGHFAPTGKEVDFKQNEFYLYEDMENYQKIGVRQGYQEVTINDTDLNCHFKYNYSGATNLMQMIAYR